MSPPSYESTVDQEEAQRGRWQMLKRSYRKKKQNTHWQNHHAAQEPASNRPSFALKLKKNLEQTNSAAWLFQVSNIAVVVTTLPSQGQKGNIHIMYITRYPCGTVVWLLGGRGCRHKGRVCVKQIAVCLSVHGKWSAPLMSSAFVNGKPSFTVVAFCKDCIHFGEMKVRWDTGLSSVTLFWHHSVTRRCWKPPPG